MREAEHLASLPVVLTQWSSLTPSSPPNWVMVGGGGVFVCVVMMRKRWWWGLIPLGGVKEGGRSRTDRQSKHRRAFGGK